ncbi:flagella basal body P-ring formation protein FlgA [Roseateles sp. DB2]|uniref:flagella basal body P-ring formation protein FlgA n=1 Tax=Roseateles sp. DB2 TaxID=3453717 RepID=UPI003EED89C6
MPFILIMLLVLLGTGHGSAHAEASACELASAAVHRWALEADAQVEVRCRGQGIYQQPLPGAVAQAPRDLTMLSGPMNWPVRVRRADGGTHTLQVPLLLYWTTPVWTLTRALPAGTLLQTEDTEIRTLPWPPGVSLTPARPESPPEGRLPRALAAGTPLNLKQLLPADQLQRGASVTATVSEGSVSLQRPARLMEPARPGAAVRVQVLGLSAVLQGRLDANHVVWVGTP